MTPSLFPDRQRSSPPNGTASEAFAFWVLPSIKKAAAPRLKPIGNTRDPSPSPVRQLLPPPWRRGDPHLLPPALAAMPLPTRPRRGASAAPRFRGGSARRRGCSPFGTVVIEPELKTPQRSPADPSPPAGALQPQPLSLLPTPPQVWLGEAGRRCLPSCRQTPRGHDLGCPSAPGSSRFLAFRLVPELSSPGTSR